MISKNEDACGRHVTDGKSNGEKQNTTSMTSCKLESSGITYDSIQDTTGIYVSLV